MRIDVIDNGGQWTHREWRMLRELGVKSKIIPNTTDPKKIVADGLVLSGGSPRISIENTKLGRIDDFIEMGMKNEIPILAICVSHQYLALFFGGKAGKAKIPCFGKNEIQIIKDDPLFKKIPNNIRVWESHNDEIKILPKNFEVLAKSRITKYEAIKLKNKPIYGLQFHPEVEHTQFGRRIFKNFIDIVKNQNRN